MASFDLRARVQRALGVHAILDQLVALRSRPIPRPAPTRVNVLLLGTYDRDGRPCRGTMGATLALDVGTRGDAKLRIQRPTKDVCIIVFCDLDLVHVHGIFCGVELLALGPGPCPIAFIDFIEPGIEVNVLCRYDATREAAG